jgi:hypothetical protein
VCRQGRDRTDELFRVEYAGEMGLTRMEYNHTDRQYYSVDRYPLRAAIGEHGKKFWRPGLSGRSRCCEQ